MPFVKVGEDKFMSPSGRVLSGAQVRAYYAKTASKRKKNKTARKARAVNRNK